jgi:hypothetical protein
MQDPVSVIIGIAQAIGTLGAVGVALWLGLRQGSSDREALHNSQRPILVPAKDTFTSVFEPGPLMKAVMLGQHEHFLQSERKGTIESPQFGLTHPANVLSFRNVGPGVAMNIDGVVTEPQPSEPSPTLARSFRLILGVPLASGETKQIIAYEGRTMLHGTAQVIPGLELYAPRTPAAGDKLRGIGMAEIRLTLTCSDTFGRVHAFVYDFTESHKWVFRDSKVVKKSIEALNREATSKSVPGPSDVPIALQGYVPPPEEN